MLRLFTAALLTTAIGPVFIAGCGDGSDEGGSAGGEPKFGDPGPVHVHGLGINPEDGALVIATHTGLFRVAAGERRAQRVADRFQDTMGFTVVGPDRFLGSGHPDGREKLPAFLGLIESRDGGENWKPLSLEGKRDFHVLEASGRRVYGFGSDFASRKASLLVSNDGGRRWEERRTPEGLVSLAIDPQNPERVIASGEKRLYLSPDAGSSWRPVSGRPSLLAWPKRRRVYAVDSKGTAAWSDDAGESWRGVGTVGGQPAAFEGESSGELYVALHDGTIKRSTDAGTSWSVRSRP